MTGRVGQLLILISLCMSMSGCFTGIESTPRISEKDVRRSNITVTAEQQLGDSLIAPADFMSWQSGRMFLVTDQRIRLAVDAEKAPGVGDTLNYIGYRLIPSMMGDTLVTLLFDGPNNQALSYSTGSTMNSLIERPRLTVPFTIDLTEVELANALLRGRKLYVITNQRVRNDGTDGEGRRFIPVTIIAVSPGDETSPLRVDFLTDDNATESVRMTVGNERRATRNFHTLFSIENPRLKYPAIDDTTWENIINGRVTEGMTREAARLAAGTPREVKKGQNGTSWYEQWTYDNGSYLIFEDGLLVRFRR